MRHNSVWFLLRRHCREKQKTPIILNTYIKLMKRRTINNIQCGRRRFVEPAE